MLHRFLMTAAVLAAAVPAAASGLSFTAANQPARLGVDARVATGSANGLTWTARNSIVGVNSTATVAGGGDPRYLPDRPRLNGVASLIMQTTAGGFICSGTLLPDRRSILTAAHCVDSLPGTLLSTTAYFYGGPDDPQTFLDPRSTAINVSRIFVNPGYTREVIDQNDIAVLRLATAAPDFATDFRPYYGTNLDGDVFNVAGYGARSDTGGNVGDNLGVGRLRQGFNRYDFRLGDPAFGGFFSGFFGTADTEFSYLSDFDNGLPANDASCLLASAFGLGGPQFCNLGLGLNEVSVAGGDSGGPQFYRGKVASVTSYGLTFGPDFGDIDDELNSSFGEFNGFVPLGIHRDFIQSSVVPEPATWAMMIAGFGLVGATLRRRTVARA